MYTYLIGWRELDTWYYGVRTANLKPPSEDLWGDYFTSSKIVKEFRELHGEPDVIRVHKVFETPHDAVEFEKKILRRMNVVSSDRFLNRTTGGSDGFHSGKYRTSATYEKISAKLKGRTIRSGWKHTDDAKAKIGEKSSTRRHTEDTKAKWSEQRKGIKPWNIGVSASEASRKKMSETARSQSHTCPHCDKTGGNVMFRWHFENCKKKVTNA